MKVVPKRPDSERIKSMSSDEFADFLSSMRDLSEPPEERMLLLRYHTVHSICTASASRLLWRLSDFFVLF